MANIIRNTKLKAISLFSGCGGMDLGIEGNFSFLNKTYNSLPFEVVYAVDNDPYGLRARDSFLKSFPYSADNGNERQSSLIALDF